MDLITAGSTTQKMTTKEIAELTGKRHADVMRDTKNLIDQRVVCERSFALTSVDTPMPKGGTRKTPVYELDFKATMALVTGYDAKRRMAVIDRWVALEEGKAKPAMVKPESEELTLSRAVLIAQKKIDEQARKLEEAKPKIELADTITNGHRTYDFKEAAKLISNGLPEPIGRNKLMDLCRKIGLLEKHTNEPYQRFINQGYLCLETKLIGSAPFRKVHKQPRITGKGLEWIARALTKAASRKAEVTA